MKATFAGALLAGCLPITSSAETAYFVVGHPPCYGPPPAESATNAYILPISQPADIRQARLLVASGGCFALNGDMKPVFRIGLGSDGTNRNVALPDEPLWSWHATDFLSWALFFGGNPYLHPWQLERDVLNGTRTDGDGVGFNGVYTTIAELNPPLALYFYYGRYSESPVELFLYWTHDAPNTAYAIEWAKSLSAPQWQTLRYDTPGIQLVGPKLVAVSPSAIDGGFFRLRADRKAAAP
ncbi:MAG: hypothetical protein HYY24_00095 [Verrucomicrobia bacterium]|nr:hypothetical protein [Verrucomicrobiota bacterium]